MIIAHSFLKWQIKSIISGKNFMEEGESYIWTE